MLIIILALTEENAAWSLAEMEKAVHPFLLKVLYRVNEMAEIPAEKSLLITDRLDFYQKAAEEQRPYLIYLHEEGEEAFWKARYVVMDLAAVDAVYLERIWRRYMQLPWNILETKRCLVREITLEDVPRLYEIYSEPAVAGYVESLYEDIEEELAYTRDYIKSVYAFYEFGTWIIVEKNTGQIIGRAGLNLREGEETPEIGYIIAGDYQRKGYATEVCRAILRYARNQLNFTEVRSIVSKENTSSIGLCEKLGFIYDDIVSLGEEEYMQYIWKSL